jgi:hypothetical protein
VLRGVISRDGGAPWGETGLTTATWQNVPTKVVQISDLIATQPGVYFQALLEQDHVPVGGDPYPHVVLYRGAMYLEDGHTRTLRALLNGESTIEARVLRAGTYWG